MQKLSSKFRLGRIRTFGLQIQRESLLESILDYYWCKEKGRVDGRDIKTE